MEKRRVLMTHYDLDGVGCDILLSKMFNFTKKHMSGYAKIKNKIEQGDLKWFDSCVVSDVCLTPEQYKEISSEYGNRFLYIDHHSLTREAISVYNNGSSVIFDDKYCATALVFQSFIKKLKNEKNIAPFVAAIDSYDLWRHKTHPKTFNEGYDLNVLFWKYGYFDFFDCFFNDFRLNFSSMERQWISDHKKNRDIAIKKSDMNEFGENSLFVMNTESTYVNDYTLQLPQYDVYFMLYVNNDDKMVISGRTTLENVSLGHVVRDIGKRYGDILTAGGHPKSCGIDLKPTTPLEVILDIVEDINNSIEAPKELPF